MKRLLLILAVLPALAFAQGEGRRYPADKFVKQKAERTCQRLASVTLHPNDYRALARHAEAETVATTMPERDGYYIVVAYPYRNDGVKYACVFRDFRSDAFIQLREFGTMDGGGAISTTKVEPLF